MEWQRARPGRLCTSRTRARVRAAAAVASPWTSCSPCSTSGRRAPPSGGAGVRKGGGGQPGGTFAPCAGSDAFSDGGGVRAARGRRRRRGGAAAAAGAGAGAAAPARVAAAAAGAAAVEGPRAGRGELTLYIPLLYRIAPWFRAEPGDDESTGGGIK
eukprot:gene25090-biopygen4472